MSNTTSVIKRIAVSERNRFRNKVYKSTIKTLTKKYLFQIKEESNQLNSHMLGVLYSKIDKAVKRGILHKNNGARKKSFLARAISNQG